MPHGDRGGPGENAYRAKRRQRSQQIRVRLSEMEEHLRTLDEHLRREVEESERWHRKWDAPPGSRRRDR